jgi:hypothetical protein
MVGVKAAVRRATEITLGHAERLSTTISRKMKIISASLQTTKNQAVPSTEVQTKPAAGQVKSDARIANKAQPGTKLDDQRTYL